MTADTIAHRTRAALLDSQRRVLERISSGAPLAEILETLVRSIEEQAHGMRCAVLLADSQQQQRLKFVAAPSIPEDYKTGIEPFLRIGSNMGSCGTAAFLREPVYTEDTATDPRWEKCRDPALRNGLRAIWSTPILSDDNSVLGTFAMYYSEPRLPSAEHVQLIDMATQMARVAIEAKRIEEALRQSEDRLRVVVETIPAMVWTALPDGSIDFVNGRWLEYIGWSSEEYQTRGWSSLVHPEDLARVSEQWEATLASGQPTQIEHRVRRADGQYRWLQGRCVPLRDESGRIVKWYGTVTDIDDRKRAEEALRQREDRLRIAIDTIPTMAWSVLPDGAVDFVNQRWLDYTGFSFERALKEANQIVHPQDLPRVMQRWLVAKTAGESFEDEMRLRRADGVYLWFLIRTVPLRDEHGTIVKWYGTSTDIEDRKLAEDERKRAENALRGSGAQLQALSRRLVELQESERKALARELHDRVGQNLTALNINLRILATALPSQASDELRVRLADSETLIESTTAAIGNVVTELRPPMLDDHGLVLALDWYARQFSARSGVSVAVREAESAERPAPEMEIVLFRIAQEALNNVLKHARASRVEITVGRFGSEYVMSVEDNGVGFADEERAALHRGLGMVTMRERSQAVGGRLEVRAIPGDGTRLTVRVPA